LSSALRKTPGGGPREGGGIPGSGDDGDGEAAQGRRGRKRGAREGLMPQWHVQCD